MKVVFLVCPNSRSSQQPRATENSSNNAWNVNSDGSFNNNNNNKSNSNGFRPSVALIMNGWSSGPETRESFCAWLSGFVRET